MDANFFTPFVPLEGNNVFDINTDLEPTNQLDSAFQSPLETVVPGTEMSSFITLEDSEEFMEGIQVNETLANWETLSTGDGIDELIGNPQPLTESQSLVFVDASIPDYQSLIAGVEADPVIILDPHQDGIQQITSVLEEYSNLASIHIVSHGSDANLQLGNTWLNPNTINDYQREFQLWGNSLSSVADILVYGCNFAVGEQGQVLVEQLSHFTGANIAASEDLTGSEQLGGDWDLEIYSGEIETSLAFTSQAMEAYQGVYLISEDELVMELQFEENSGSQAVDSSPNGGDNQGFLRNGASFSQENAPFGGVVTFDGDDDYVEVNNSADINLSVNAKRTVAVWFKVDDVSVSDRKQVIFEAGGRDRGLNIYVDNGNLYVGGWNEPESNWSGTYLSTDTISSDTWHHVALVLDATPGDTTLQSGAFSAYLDGVQFGQGEGSQLSEHIGGIGLGALKTNTQFHDGDVVGTGIQTLQGSIADAKIYNRVLSATEIATLADPSSLAPSPLVAHLKFDETSGTQASDSSPDGQDNPGVLVNSATFEPVGGDLGGGVRFDGNNDYVVISNSTDINIGIYPERTVSVWFNGNDINRTSSKQVIYEEGGSLRGLNVYVDSGSLYVGGWNEPESNWLGTYLSTDTIDPDTWHHVALVLNTIPDSTTLQPGAFTAYLDGVEFGQGEASQLWSHSDGIALGALNESTKFHDGNATGTASQGFTGTIADARIYNGALSVAEISAIAALQPPNNNLPTASLIANDLTTEGGATYEFSVIYSDDNGIDVTSLDKSDLLVTGVNGFSQLGTLVSVDSNDNGSPRTAVYSINAPGDGWSEADQGTYTITLQSNQVSDTSGNFALEASLGNFNVDILNAGAIGLGDSTINVNEGDGSVSVTVLRTEGSEGTVTIDYRTFGASATANADYTETTDTLVFAPGETSKSVIIPILEDSLFEGEENFGFTIDNVTGGATLLAPRTALISIEDNDSVSGALTYNGNQYLLTSGALTWEQAQAEATNLGGNLVTINDALEERWLQENFGQEEGFWIGINDIAIEGQFEWVSGQPVTYTNWTPGEPNNTRGIEDFGQINFSPTRQWNDNLPTALLRGIIEFGGSNPAPIGTGNGLQGEYYDNIDFTNIRLTRTDPTVDFDWGSGSPNPSLEPDTFSVRWTGQIEPRYSETYTFQTITDDGVRLWVNDQLLIDQFIDQSPATHTGTIALEALEQYDIRLEYYENETNALAQLLWSSSSQPLEIVPQSQLYSTPVNTTTFTQETVISNFNRPTSIDWTPDGEIMFIAEKAGVVNTFQNDTLNPVPFIDISTQVNNTNDRGLIDIAVHPDFSEHPYVYLLYAYDPPEVFQNTDLAGPDGRGNRAGRLTRVTADPDTNFTTAIPGSEVVILGTNSTWDNFNAFVNSTFDFDEPPAGILPDGSNLQDFLAADSTSHTIGAVEFGPDGALYVSNGDGTSFNQVDPRTVRVQDIDNLSGKILRIDPITGEGLSDNPFYDGDPNSNRSKVYQFGFRNPFRFTINPETGDVAIGDVGWFTWEEINIGEPGANFGWPYYEGGNGVNIPTAQYQDLPEAQAFYDSGETVTPSILGLNHFTDGANAIVVGDYYTGDAFPEEYQGDLFFNDLRQGIVRNISFDESGNITDINTFTTGAEVVVQIVEGPDGALYYVELRNGVVGRWFFT